MTAPSSLELHQRLALIDQLIQETRVRVSASGWIFAWYGLGHLLALIWQWWLPHGLWAFPVVMGVWIVPTAVVYARSARRRRVRTATGSSVAAIWAAFGASLAVAFIFDRQHPLETFFLLIGFANVASGLALRWRTQVLVGMCWWVAAAVCLTTSNWTLKQACFLVMALVGEVGFGCYLMWYERSDATTHKDHGHAPAA